MSSLTAVTVGDGCFSKHCAGIYHVAYAATRAGSWLCLGEQTLAGRTLETVGGFLQGRDTVVGIVGIEGGQLVDAPVRACFRSISKSV